MTPTDGVARRENVLLVHWHDLGRHLHAYGEPGVVSPHTDELARTGILFTDAHATAPLCSPARSSIFTGRYPHSNGIVGLAHHGFAYRHDVRTLPHLLAENGWETTLFGMQHETTDPATLGYQHFDVSESRCDTVVERASRYLAQLDEDRPFLLNAGFFETHRPYPLDEYRPADPATVTIPPPLPDTDDVREDLASFYGSITAADAAVGRLLAVLDDLGLGERTWVVFFTDHGAAFPRAKSTLYGAGTGIAFMVRPPTARRLAPQRFDALFSGVDLLPTLLDLLGVPVPDGVEGVSHAAQLLGGTAVPARSEVFTEKTFHDTYDPIRAVRTKEYSYIENLAPRPELDLPLDILDSPSGQALREDFTGPRPAVELYDLAADPFETLNLAGTPGLQEVQDDLAARLAAFRSRTADVVPSDADGTNLAALNLAAYLKAHPQSPTVVQRSPQGTERGYASVASSPRGGQGGGQPA